MTEQALRAGPEDGGRIVVDGVVYVPIDARAMTLEHRLYAIEQMAGLRPPRDYAAIADDSGRGLAILADARRSGHAFTLLATILVRADMPWSEHQAAEAAERFRVSTGDAADALQDVLKDTLLKLFKSGSSSARTSPSSSPQTTATESSSAPDTSAPPDATLAAGTPPSASSPDTTPHGTARSFADRSGKSSGRSASDSVRGSASATTSIS